MEQDFIVMFGAKPKAYVSPLEPGDHPEFDESDLLDFEGIKQYQSLIGSIQWAGSTVREVRRGHGYHDLIGLPIGTSWCRTSRKSQALDWVPCQEQKRYGPNSYRSP
jgi:hypothetical protein